MMRLATSAAAPLGASTRRNTVTSGVTDIWRATGCTDTRMALPSKGRASASAMTSRLANDEKGCLANRRTVTINA
ncbi:hypothetical protein D3C72_1655760 [compost metagenome]